MKLSSTEITPENSAPMAAIEGYQNGLEFGYDGLNIVTMWAGNALAAYKMGVKVGAAKKIADEEADNASR